MNTLVLYIMYEFIWLSIGVDRVRNWRRYGSRVLSALWLIAAGAGAALGAVFLLDLVMHPAKIQPVSGWRIWVLYAGLLAILLYVGGAARSLLQRVTHRR